VNNPTSSKQAAEDFDDRRQDYQTRERRPRRRETEEFREPGFQEQQRGDDAEDAEEERFPPFQIHIQRHHFNLPLNYRIDQWRRLHLCSSRRKACPLFDEWRPCNLPKIAAEDGRATVNNVVDQRGIQRPCSTRCANRDSAQQTPAPPLRQRRAAQ